MARLRFRFSLTPLDQVGHWGDGSLHWFGLTDGTYWIELGEHDLLRHQGEPVVDYYVARFWEDLCLLAPDVLEKVPADLAEFMLADVDDSVECEIALGWRGDHCLDFGYLADAPRNLWWRTGDELTVMWWDRDRPPIREQVRVDDFLAALADFDRELMAAMDDRVAQVEAGGAPAGSRIDIPGLRREHDERARWLRESSSRISASDWAAIRVEVRRLLS